MRDNINIKNMVEIAIKDSGSSIEPEILRAFIATESGGKGFDSNTGKLLIQFEPAWFKRREPYAPSGAWSVNKVEVQSKEWEAFNNAFKINPDSAMESTSIGLPQIMGGHWNRLGFESVGSMWDYFKKGELAQIKSLVKFIETDRRLLKAIIEKDWHMIAYIYNGSGYAALAHKYGREPYNVTMEKFYKKFLGEAK